MASKEVSHPGGICPVRISASLSGVFSCPLLALAKAGGALSLLWELCLLRASCAFWRPLPASTGFSMAGEGPSLPGGIGLPEGLPEGLPGPSRALALHLLGLTMASEEVALPGGTAL